ncbi:MAG TPA: uracil-DNA glycosylase [Terriglobia bacterium]|nr:uracil-DNA glycosylase [Terriglobia bacterium]
MDDPTRKELKAWLEFYQELGIEGFYRREPGTVEARPSLEAAQPAQPATAPAPRPAPAPAPARAATPPVPMRVTVGPDTGPRTPDFGHIIRPPAPSFSLFEAAPARRSGPETLEQIREDLGDCRRCKLAPTRKTIVFGEGNPHAELVFIGEGPGADEDEQGLPFVGRAGKLLNRMMQTVGLKREDVYICNIVKCRPPENRTPEKDEVDACSPFLYRQIEAIKPRLICCLGAPAVRTVLGIKEGITKIRGQFYDFGSTKALATVHPAYVLRNPREEKILREDFEKIREFLKGA